MTILSPAFDSLANLAQHANLSSSRLSYGTAGFRADADKTPLDFVMYRVGCLIGLRSRVLGGAACGAMITASHNEQEDNGVKMVEPDGSMLDSAWELIADRVINCKTTSELKSELEAIPHDPKTLSVSGLVFIGYDTRSSSERLVQCLIRGCNSVGAQVENYHLLSTPVVHHIVRHANGFGHCITMASVEGYSRMLKEGLVEMLASNTRSSPVNRGRLVIDLAGGVGTSVMRTVLANKVKDTCRILLGIPEILFANESTNSAVLLNEKCGAEYAQKKRLCPSLFFSSFQNIGADRVASFDGDADRLVYSYTHPIRGWRLIDGDKIATLYAMFVNQELLKAGVNTLSVGLVQTAYANGASTHFVCEKMASIQVKLAKTGVKFVEHAAKEFDIGMYFEANGHGTVIFSKKAITLLETMRPKTNRLLGFYKLINQAVGDAISDCLGVEAILALLGLSVEHWDNLYEDLPSRQGKIAISDRTLIKCTEDETRVLTPASLQTDIDALVASFGTHARAFVRPSGTEDAARVYAEATTTEAANMLALQVARAAWKAVGKAGSKEPSESEYL